MGLLGFCPVADASKCLLSRAAFREGNRSLFYRHEPISVLIGAKVKLLVNEIRPVSFIFHFLFITCMVFFRFANELVCSEWLCSNYSCRAMLAQRRSQ